MLRSFVLIPAVLIFGAIVLHEPGAVSDPAANPLDPAKEDLGRVYYPSQDGIEWESRFIKPNDSLVTIFGKDWPYIARFNRIDRRHTYPGMTIKVPKRMEDAKNYVPLPLFYEQARRYEKYILISLTEQWLGAYERGKLKFSMPAATGTQGYETPTGLFRVDARHKNHTSSLYKTEDESEQYPMDNAIRFHIGPDNVSYWIHARDLPGRPASHGCVGLFDESMQKRMYGIPADPLLADSKKLYDWAVGEDDYGYDSGSLELLESGPVVEVIGSNPPYLGKNQLARN